MKKGDGTIPFIAWENKKTTITTGQWGPIKYDVYCKNEAKRIGGRAKVYQDGDLFCVDIKKEKIKI